MLYRIEVDWYSLLDDLTSTDEARAARARKTLRDDLTLMAPLLAKKPFFMSDEFALIECSIAPILWRLSSYGIELPSQAKSVVQYGERIFGRDSFKSSLSDVEQELRQLKEA